MKEHRTVSFLAGVFDNGRAPVGFVEIQRNDSIDEGPEDLDPLNDDGEAASLVARVGGMPGSALVYHTGLGIFVGVDTEKTMLAELDRFSETLELDGSWICVVPARAAFTCKMIDAQQLADECRGK